MAASQKYIEGTKTVLQSTAVRQVLFMVGVAVSVAVGIVLYMSIQEPIYRPLDYQVNQQNVAAIVDTLEKAGIQYKINEQDGVVLVSAKDAQMARLKLASAGITKDDGFNFAFLNDKNAFENSQFIENARYIRALESDLSKTINSIEGISGSRVHIAIPQNNIFADENNKVTASVIINLAPGFASDKEKIRSVLQIVAGSVPGLDPKNVSISDQYGHYLSETLNQDAVYSAAQLSYQNNIQKYYEKRIEEILIPMFGDNKVTVKVNADIDFTTQENTEEQYDPEKKVLRSEQTLTEQNDSGNGASGTPGSLANSPPDDANKTGNAGGGGAGGAGGSGSSSTTSTGAGRNQSTKNYELSRSVVYKKSNFAKIKNLSVAVVIDNESIVDPKTKQLSSKPLDKDKITKITDLVKATVGFDEARGDKVTVINSSYNLTKPEMLISQQKLWEQPWFWDISKKIIGIILGFIFLFVLSRQISRIFNTNNTPRKAAKSKSFVEAKKEQDEEANEIKANMHDFKEEGMTKLKQLASSEPNKVALIIKSWVGKP